MAWAQDRATDGGTLLMSATYVYDVFDRLIEEDVYTPATGTTTVTRYGYDGANAWADLNGSDQLTMRRLYLDAADAVFARIAADGTVAWYLADRQGSIRDIVSLTGATVLDHIEYDAYGNVTLETNAANGDWVRYNGGRLDAATGYILFGERWYNPATGSWTERDPSGFGGGDYNLSRYVGNGPTDGTDPTGLINTRTAYIGGYSGEATGAIAGGVIGTILIPIPGVGTAIGVVGGGIAGGLLGYYWGGHIQEGPDATAKAVVGGCALGATAPVAVGVFWEGTAPLAAPAARAAWAAVVGWFTTHPDQVDDVEIVPGGTPMPPGDNPIVIWAPDAPQVPGGIFGGDGANDTPAVRPPWMLEPPPWPPN